MPDKLFLSLWVEGFSALSAPGAFKKALSTFPFSKLNPAVTLRVHAIEFTEVPVLERDYADPSDLDEIISDAQEFHHEDTAFQVEGYWDLWQWDEDWTLKPSLVVLEVYSPEFDSPQGENINFDLGLETLFLPPEPDPFSLKPLQSNIRSVLHLVKDFEMAFSVRKKLLWNETGDNFADKLGSGYAF
jgi:hypothetical protein